MGTKKTAWAVWLRRATQAGFLVLFFHLFLQTTYHPINETGKGVDLFFEIDPLVMTTVWLAAHTIVAVLLFSIITLALTFVFGRWFCGWICPLGTLHNLATSVRDVKVKQKLQQGGYSRWQRSKYYLLAGFLGAALVGSNTVGWLDPICFLYRSTATAIYPVLNLGIQKLFGWIYRADPGAGKVRLTAVTEPVYEVLRRTFLAVEQPHYFWGLMIGLLFGMALAVNLFRARFWCRYVCPLGALLGITGKNPLVRIATDPASCNDCRLCTADCQGGADPQGGVSWKPAECFYCLNCRSSCPSDAISVRFEVPGKKLIAAARWISNFFCPPKEAKLDLSRRTLIAAGVTGLGGGLLFGTGPLGGGKACNPELIRPPGALGEEEFLARCVRCGECMKVCPTNAIQPTFAEAGLQGMWSPVLKMKMGYCEYECTLCTQVCPTDAIRELSVQEKQQVKIGLAYFDRNRCLPYALARNCIVCEEHCPTPKKAIWFEEADVRNSRGEMVRVKQPHVNPELCIGCGICENKCPVFDRAAVIVTSVGETRNPRNQTLLPENVGGPY